MCHTHGHGVQFSAPQECLSGAKAQVLRRDCGQVEAAWAATMTEQKQHELETTAEQQQEFKAMSTSGYSGPGTCLRLFLSGSTGYPESRSMSTSMSISGSIVIMRLNSRQSQSRASGDASLGEYSHICGYGVQFSATPECLCVPCLSVLIIPVFCFVVLRYILINMFWFYFLFDCACHPCNHPTWQKTKDRF